MDKAGLHLLSFCFVFFGFFVALAGFFAIAVDAEKREIVGGEPDTADAKSFVWAGVTLLFVGVVLWLIAQFL